MKTFSLLSYTFSHYAVDFACFWILFGRFSENVQGNEQALGFIIYNFIAFGLQMVIGAYCDEHRKFPSAAIGCSMVFLAVLICPFLPWISLFVTAFGNAFFHVGGGMDSLVNSGGKISRGGVFVSAGALGVIYGSIAGSKTAYTVFLPVQLIKPAGLVLIGALLCYIAHKKLGIDGDTKIKGSANGKLAVGLVIALALISVLIRSFGGTLIPMGWKATMRLGIVSAFAAFLGKFLGGFAADIFGAKNTGVISLLLSLPLIILGRENMILSAFGILLFNMTMPITLAIIAEKLPKNPGIAFGLTTAALLLGAVPSFFVALGGNIALLIPAVIISAACIFFAAGNKKSALEE